MSLIVEDGSNVPGANSYVSLVDARAILIPLGQDLDVDDIIAEQQLLNSMRYVEAFRVMFKGTKTTSSRSLQWPRTGVVIDDVWIDNNVIPQDLIDSQVFAAYEIEIGEVLQPTVTGQSVAAEEVVGAVKVAYFQTGAIDGSSIFVRVRDSLNPLLDNSAGMLRGMRG